MSECRSVFYRSVLLVVITMVVTGCAKTYSVKPSSPVKLFARRTETALNSSRPSGQTQQKLRLMFLEDEYETDAAAVVEQLYEQVRQTNDPQLMTVTAELALLEARKLQRRDTGAAVAMNLMAASLAYDYLFGAQRLEPADALAPSYRFMADIYNMAVSKLVENRAAKDSPWVDSSGVEILKTSYDLKIRKAGGMLWDPRVFDSIDAVNDIQVKGLRNEYFSKGLGAPMVGLVDNPQARSEFGRYFPLKGAAFPTTAVLSFDKPTYVGNMWHRKAELTFYNTILTEYTFVNGMKVPLEADYSTPLGVLLSRIHSPDLGFEAMLRSDKLATRTGIHMLQAYHPNKIPVVMVHGLMSTPETWVDMFNDLVGDRRIRRDYQFWFFIYPTGLPIVYSASILRRDLLEMREQFDPMHTNPRFDHMVVVGHSLGGLLTRLIAQDSGTFYWDNVFAKPIDKVSLSQSDKEFLQDIFFFEPLPFVDRVVFIATPHRGSKLADKWFARIGAGFVSLPTNIEDVGGDIMAEDTAELAFDPKEFSRRVPNSIDLLSPTSRFIATMQKVPLDTTIPYHSLIGVRKATTGPGSSDGVVAYESSHLDFVVSEKLVPSGHSAHRHPLAIAEVKRILKLHADEIKKKPTVMRFQPPIYNIPKASFMLP